MATTLASQVQELYIGYLGRAADKAGLDFWVKAIENGTSTLESVALGFTLSAEYKAAYEGLTTSQLVAKVYQNVLGRAADADGLGFWVGEINKGVIKADTLVKSMINSLGAIDQLSMDNKVQAANIYTTTAGDNYDLDAAKAAIGATSGNAGQTFVLTTGVDNVVGDAGNNTIDGSRAVLQGQIVDTLGNADKIDGGAGTDTLFVQNVTANASIAPNSIKNVEVLHIENMATGAYTLNLQNADSAIKSVKVSNTTAAGGTVSVTNNASALTDLALDNVTNAVSVASAAAAVAGTTDALNISLSSVTGNAGITAQGYETVTISSNGSVANAPGRLINTSLTTLNIKGDQNLTLTLDDAGATNPAAALATINASEAKGRISVTLDANMVQNVAVTGGAGNDTIDMNGTYTTGDVINGGAGNDILVLNNNEATAAAAVQANVSNIETIRLSNGLNGTVAVNNFGATGLTFGANLAGAGVINYAAGTNNLDISTFNSNTVTVNVAGTATNDVLNVVVGNATAGTGNAGSAHAYTINGAETVNLSSVGAANTFGAAFTLTDTAATQALVITGNQNLTFTGAVRADSIDASGMTGNAALALNGGTGTTATSITGTANGDTLIGSTAGDIINGGAGNDTITNAVTGTAASAADVLTGGAGNDTFVLHGVTANGAVATILATTSFVTDFTVGATATTTDILALSATEANYGAGLTQLIAGQGAQAAGTTAVQTIAQNAAATGLVTGADLLKFTTGVATTGLTLQQAFDAAIGTASVTTVAAGEEYFFTVYDTTNGRMLVGVVDAGDTTIAATDVVTLVGSLTMSAADYAAFNQNNLAIVA